MKRPAPPVQQRLHVGNRAGAADTAFSLRPQSVQFTIQGIVLPVCFSFAQVFLF